MFQIPRATLTIDHDGLWFASRHRLARMDAKGRLDVDTNEERILGLLCLAYRQPVPDWVIPKLRKAATEWNAGRHGPAALRLIHMGLADVSGDADAMDSVQKLERDFDFGLVPAGAIRKLIDAAKSGYDPNEPRDDHGRWTSEEQGSSAKPVRVPTGDSDHNPRPSHSDQQQNPLLEDVDYNGEFHDQLVSEYAENARKAGKKAYTEVRLIGPDGRGIRADLLVEGRPGELPYVVEVKTGLDPTFTDNQRVIYPLTELGGHVYSPDPIVANLGLEPNTLLPPLQVVVLYKMNAEEKPIMIPLWKLLSH